MKIVLDTKVILSAAELTSAAELVQPTPHASVIKDDPSDNDVLDYALEPRQSTSSAVTGTYWHSGGVGMC